MFNLSSIYSARKSSNHNAEDDDGDNDGDDKSASNTKSPQNVNTVLILTKGSRGCIPLRSTRQDPSPQAWPGLLTLEECWQLRSKMETISSPLLPDSHWSVSDEVHLNKRERAECWSAGGWVGVGVKVRNQWWTVRVWSEMEVHKICLKHSFPS